MVAAIGVAWSMPVLIIGLAQAALSKCQTIAFGVFGLRCWVQELLGEVGKMGSWFWITALILTLPFVFYAIGLVNEKITLSNCKHEAEQQMQTEKLDDIEYQLEQMADLSTGSEKLGYISELHTLRMRRSIRGI